MSEKEKIGRLVLRFDQASRANCRPGEFQFNVNMGNFATNQDDLVYLQLDYISTVIMSSDTLNADGSVANTFQGIEVFLDVPQYHSYDNAVGTETQHLALMDRNIGQLQTTQLTPANYPNLATTPSYWQAWTLAHKPEYLAVRPEVLQSKPWRIRFSFTGTTDNKTILDPSNVPAFAAGGMNVVTMVISVTK